MNESHHLSRRNLLAMAAVGAGGLLAGNQPTRADSPQANPVANQKAATLRWGIIGTGTRGAFTHIPTLKEAPDSELLALCDVSEERLQTAAAKVAHPVTTYADYQKLLANPDINAVVIATPNLLHREMLAAAIQAGKHVLCEKPAGASPTDAIEMEQSAGSTKNVLMFGMQYRNSPKSRKFTELVSSGHIGKPRYMIQNCSRGDWNLSPNVWRFADPNRHGDLVNWRFAHAASGGTLNEFSCHYLDLLHGYAGGLPEAISCEGGISVYHDGRDTWDHATVTLKYSNDLTAVHTLCLFGQGHADLQIIGDEGSIESVGDSFKFTQFVTRQGKKKSSKVQKIELNEPPSHGVDNAVLELYKDFLVCVQTGKKPDASPARALAASRTCWLAEAASDRKAEVKWDELVAPRT
jgi:predicted dehydrogenase